MSSSALCEVHIKGMLSNGQTFDGKLLRDNGTKIIVRGATRSITIMPANISECTLKFIDEEIPKNMASVSLYRLGKFLLAKKYKFL
ncbi:MAG: hypothetical protein GY794_00615, partial [bacterium]|nr:hypothetical protein [bacterium]